MVHKILFVVFAVTLSCPIVSWAKLPHYGTLSGISAGLVYANLLERRGVVEYRDFQAIPSISFFFFDDRLEVLEDSVSYRDFIYQNKIRFRTRLASISDKPFFPNYSSVREGMPDRPSSWEWQNGFEFFFPAYDETYISELDVTYSKDISIHHGDYFDIVAKFRLGSFNFPVLNYKAEPNFVVTAGAGDSRHNQYFYGPSDTSTGINNASVGFWVAFPEEADRWYPVIELMAFQTVGDHGHAEYSEGRNRGVLFAFIATTGLL